MKREELEKEAEEYLHKDGTEAEKLVKDIGMLCLTKKQLNGFFAIFKQVYIDSAEPREKRIAELEAQIERNKIDLAISEHDREHNDYELTEAYKKIEQLEKENAELKKLKRECETSLCRAEYQYNYEQLTKAKEHIQTLISCLIDWVQEGDKDYCHIADAKQFISEVEK